MKEYKRLTNKNEYGKFYKCKELGCYDYCIECEMNDKAIERLAELEDKIENGTLVELPCKVGDKVYCISNSQIIIFTVKEVIINEYRFYLRLYDGKDTMTFTLLHFEDFLFFNKAEAEQRLKELKNELD